ncbi:uncharacterized protein LOC124492348 [Dermatophagoides farinae]|uniref:Uncharacterized protein n=1 Tax=Dermatophagoides farinae TaxID=6954 RepID=A0A9D4SK88_DERFA|nr:hypothetical protein HUG17_0426 [Dermatophagoides farinae]
MSSIRISFILFGSLMLISIVHASSPFGGFGSSLFMPMYSRRLNLHSGFYGSRYGSPHGFGMVGGSRNGQGFVGNPGIGIRQSSETLANVYPQMSYSPSLSSYGITPSSSSLLMMPSSYSSSPLSSLYGGGHSSFGGSFLSSPIIG